MNEPGSPLFGAEIEEQVGKEFAPPPPSHFRGNDFDLFDHVELRHASPSAHFQSASSLPQFPPFEPPHSISTFSHLQSRAVAFDHSLQSPLGESPLVFGSHSVSPQLSDVDTAFWSPAAPTEPAGSPAISPLLLDNLGLESTSGGGGGRGSTAEPFEMFERRRDGSLDGLVSNYLPSTSNSTQGRGLGRRQLSSGLGMNRPGFSPVMSQRTFENLLEGCESRGLPPLPPLPSTEHKGEEEQEEEQEEEPEDEQEEELGGDSEWIPSSLSSTRHVTRSTRSRPSLSASTVRSSRHASGASPPVLSIDAPIQPRTYQIDSRTSRKPIPKNVLKRHERALEEGHVSKEELESVAARKRRLNTLSARESRKRKAEAIEEQAKENVELKEMVGTLRLRVGELSYRVGELEGENEGLRNRVFELEQSRRGHAGVGDDDADERKCTKRQRRG